MAVVSLCLAALLCWAGRASAEIQIAPVLVYNDWSAGVGVLSYLDDPEAPDEVGETVAVHVGATFSLAGPIGGDIRYSHVASLIGDELVSTMRRHSTLDALLTYSVPIGKGQIKVLAGPTVVDIREDWGYADGGWGIKYGAAAVVPITSKLTAEGFLRYAPNIPTKRRSGSYVEESFTSQSADENLTLTYSLDSLLKNLSLRVSIGASQVLEDFGDGQVLLDYDVASLGASYRF
jgi:hypothetical protein